MSSIRCVQVNLHHAKGASGVLCRRFTKDQLSVALIQEPWVHDTRILGLANTNKFIQRDLVAIAVEVPTTNGTQEVVVASAYFPGDEDDIPPSEVAALVRYCRSINKPLIVGCDANAHHTVWGSSDVNTRAISGSNVEELQSLESRRIT
ncbi:uncharacterized protein LOC129725235 [Wyeomyia smithii]|uniref:uncharacterized protein LOC129725235 n=1 Tax=Wyeomyia smithii TaxID=174621 RepID=UPI0024680DA5|nr:uncharacterized protein LOC129725235 [Wyeomyia smithii]